MGRSSVPNSHLMTSRKHTQMNDPHLFQLTEKPTGLPTHHTVRFKGQVDLIAGRRSSDSALENVADFTGLLLDRYHTADYLMVEVLREPHWSRRRSWVGIVEGRSLKIIPRDNAGNMLTLQQAKEVFPTAFWSAWHGRMQIGP